MLKKDNMSADVAEPIKIIFAAVIHFYMSRDLKI